MSHKLLLADDSVTIQRVIELTFADEDIKVSVVGDGRQAIERIASDRPDIVLADIGMPERDGYEVAAFVKSDPRFADIPVILLTGAFEPLDEERARKAGCDGVLVKPFEPQVVINRVKELLSRPRAVASAIAPPTAQAGDRVMDKLDAALALAPPPAPVDAPKSGDALEDYFDRLDAAFANIATPAGHPRVEPPHEELSAAVPGPQSMPQAAPAADPMNPGNPESNADAAPAPPTLATAFAALLAAEEGDEPPNLAAFGAPAISDEMIEDIVRRVIERMGDQLVRQAVLDVAERLVRQEIDRIKLEARRPSAPHAGR